MIQACPSHAPQEALTDGIRPRGAGGYAPHLDAANRGDARAGRPELAVVVADQVAWSLVEGGGLAERLGDPSIRRVARHTAVDHPAGAQLHEEEGEERAEQQLCHREAVAGLNQSSGEIHIVPSVVHVVLIGALV